MATNNRITGSGNESFKQIEGDNWSSIYLPAICAGVIMTVVLFVAIACSKKSDNAASHIGAPTQPAATSSSAPVAAATPLPEAPKRIKKHRPTNATYMSGTYGVSFSYPRKYSLATGSQKSAMPLQPNFLKPGAVEVAAVDMPDDTYPDTDFSSALLNVKVNSEMTAEECAQFVPAANDSNTVKPTAIKLGANEFAELEQMSGEDTHQSDLKYFHVFKNNACYEFALDVETARKADEDLAQVDRGQAFKQLEKILSTARIKEVKLPGVEAVASAASTASADSKSADASAPDSTSAKPASSDATPATPTADGTGSTSVSASGTQTEKAQAVTPDQK